MGVMLYRSALFAERQRQDLFAKGELPKPGGTAKDAVEC